MRVTQARRILTGGAWILDDEERSGAPGGIRTPDPLLRRQILYPAELRARCLKTLPILAVYATFTASMLTTFLDLIDTTENPIPACSAQC